MVEQRSIKFEKAILTSQMITLLLRSKVPFRVTKDRTIHYSSRFDELVDSEILTPLRSRVIKRWQLLSFPKEWATVYRDYMKVHKIKFSPEWINGELVYLLPATAEPHKWNLRDPSAKRAEAVMT